MQIGVQSPIPGHDMTVVGQLRRVQRDGTRRASVAVTQADRDARIPVFAVHMKLWASRIATAGATLAEQRFDKIAELFAADATKAITGEASAALAAKLGTVVPTGRRPKILAILPVRAKVIVGGTLTERTVIE